MRLTATRLTSYGQSLSRRFAPNWTPAALGSALALWLDAADASTITLNGSDVSQWNDKSGNERHALQNTAADQPTYTLNALNGRPAISFQSDFMEIASTPIFSAGNADLGIFGLINQRAPDGGTIFANYLAGNLQMMSTQTPNIYTTPWGIWNNAEIDMDPGPALTGQNIMFSAVRTSGSFTGYTNGEQKNTITNSASVYEGAGTQSAWRLGANTAGGERGSFLFYEFVATNTALSATDRQRLEGYLAWKWALQENLPANHPFKNSPPTV